MKAHYQMIIDELNAKREKAKSKIVPDEKNSATTILDDKAKEILLKLEKFEQGRLFLKSNINLAFLAGHLNTNVNFLSSVINKHKSQNFNDYINTLRIDYIIEKLQNESKYRNFKISSLAEESGFS